MKNENIQTLKFVVLTNPKNIITVQRSDGTEIVVEVTQDEMNYLCEYLDV